MVCKYRCALSLVFLAAVCVAPAPAYSIYAGLTLAVHQDIPDGSLPGGRLPNDFHVEGLICTKHGVLPVLYDSRNGLFQSFGHQLTKLNPLDPEDCWYYFSADWTNPTGGGIPYCTVIELGLLFYIEDENTMIDLSGWWTLDGVRVGQIVGYHNGGYQPLTGFSVGTNTSGQPIVRVGNGFIPPIIGPMPWPTPSPEPMTQSLTELDVLSVPGGSLPTDWFNELREEGAQAQWPWISVVNTNGLDISPSNPVLMAPDSFFDVFLELSGTGQIHPVTPVQVPAGNMLFVRSRRMFTNNAGVPDPHSGLWEWHIHEAQTASEACCFSDGRCEMRTPADCVQVGGFPMGAGSTCDPNNPCQQPQTGACCYGQTAPLCVVTTEVLCNTQYLGQFKGVGTNCDDNDGDGVADVCEQATTPEACCLPDGTCQMLDPVVCAQMLGTPMGAGTRCLGDLNGNGRDDLCDAKWYQMPDLSTTGIDVKATFPNVLADDFLCTKHSLITDITVFGSWLNDVLPDGPMNVQFTLSIHADIPDPDGSGPAYSMPGPVLWQHVFPPGSFLVQPFQTDINEGWWDPFVPGSYIFPGDHVCWQYYFPVPAAQAFCQQGTPDAPIVYWLDVQAQPLGTSDSQFGWKTSLSHWNDDAVAGRGLEPYPGPWTELRYPPLHPYYPQSLDLAFAIGGDLPCVQNEACCLGNGSCVDVDPTTCMTVYLGTPMGAGTTCATLPPMILVQPVNQGACQNDDVTFTVVVCGATPLQYQWRKNGAPVGPNSPTLSLPDVHLIDAGTYDVLVTNAFGAATSNPAKLKVWPKADSNCDGAVNNQDIDPFVVALFGGQAAWEALGYGCDFICANDCNRDGAVNNQDIDGFVACLFGNCP